MAEAAAGAAQAEVSVRSVFAPDAQPDDLIAADGYLFVCPENLASMAGAMKEFFDRCYYPCLDRLNGRPYAAMICAGSDGTGAARQLARIATGWRLKAIAEPLIVGVAAQTPDAILAPTTLTAAQLAPCAELGATLAAGLALGVF
jgi:multimeric flavodoxin WrbA